MSIESLPTAAVATHERLIEVALLVHQWLQCPGVRDRFRDQIAVKIGERTKLGPADQPNADPGPDRTAWSLARRYDSLAAIHDFFIDEIERRGEGAALIVPEVNCRTETDVAWYHFARDVVAVGEGLERSEVFEHAVRKSVAVVRNDLVGRGMIDAEPTSADASTTALGGAEPNANKAEIETLVKAKKAKAQKIG